MLKVLLNKEFELSYIYIVLALVFCFFAGQMGYMVSDNLLAQGRFLSIVIFASQSVFSALVNADDKSKVDILLNSLPLDKKIVIGARYLSNLIITPIIASSVFIFTRIYSGGFSLMLLFSPANKFTLSMMIFTIGLNTLFLSLLLPIFYASPKKAKAMSGIISMLVLLAPLVFHNYLVDLGNISNLFLYNTVFCFIFLLIAYLIYYLSLKHSLKLYDKKEF